MLTIDRQQAGLISLLIISLGLSYVWAKPAQIQHQAIRLTPSLSEFPFIQRTSPSMPAAESEGAVAPLKITPELRLIFDYFYNKSGWQKLPVAKAELSLCLSQQMAAAQLSQAQDLFTRYASYLSAWSLSEQKQASLGLEQSSYQAVASRLRIMHELRASFFSAIESQALFAIDDEYDKNYLQQLLLAQNSRQAGLTLEQPKVLQLADNQLKNYQGYYLQHLSSD